MAAPTCLLTGEVARGGEGLQARSGRTADRSDLGSFVLSTVFPGILQSPTDSGGIRAQKHLGVVLAGRVPAPLIWEDMALPASREASASLLRVVPQEAATCRVVVSTAEMGPPQHLHVN